MTYTADSNGDKPGNSDFLVLNDEAIVERLADTFLREDSVNELVSEAWDDQYARDSDTCDELHDVGKFFIPLGKDGKISDDFRRLVVYLSGATIALVSLDELCRAAGINIEDFREYWRTQGRVKVVDTSRLSDATEAEKYDAISDGIVARGQLHLTTLNPKYGDLIERIADEYSKFSEEIVQASGVFKASYGYVLGEGYESLLSFIASKEMKSFDAELATLLDTQADWADSFLQQAYEVQKGKDVDITIEMSRIQKIFESIRDQHEEIDYKVAEKITAGIEEALCTDDSLENAIIPDGARVTIRGARMIMVYPYSQVGLPKEVEIEGMEDKDVMVGEYVHTASVAAHPPGNMEVEEWIKVQTTVYSPGIVLKNVGLLDDDGGVRDVQQDMAVLISLDHPGLSISYRLEE